MTNLCQRKNLSYKSFITRKTKFWLSLCLLAASFSSTSLSNTFFLEIHSPQALEPKERQKLTPLELVWNARLLQGHAPYEVSHHDKCTLEITNYAYASQQQSFAFSGSLLCGKGTWRSVCFLGKLPRLMESCPSLPGHEAKFIQYADARWWVVLAASLESPGEEWIYVSSDKKRWQKTGKLPKSQEPWLAVSKIFSVKNKNYLEAFILYFGNGIVTEWRGARQGLLWELHKIHVLQNDEEHSFLSAQKTNSMKTNISPFLLTEEGENGYILWEKAESQKSAKDFKPRFVLSRNIVFNQTQQPSK